MMLNPRRWLVALMMTGISAAASGAAIDGYKLRQTMDAAAFAAEVADMKARLYKDIDHERLAAMVVAGAARNEADYQALMAKVQRAAAAGRVQIDNVAGGEYPAASKDNRWLKDAAAAKDPFARKLFERTFLDQYYPDSNLSGDLGYAATVLIIPAKMQVTRDNALWLKGVLKRIGWFDISKYGEDASMAAWLIVQHADFDVPWQAAVLAALKPRMERREVQPRYYAYLSDRVAVARHEAQIYGTQGRCAGPIWTPFTLRDPAQVDARRAAVGLGKLSAYQARFHCK